MRRLSTRISNRPKISTMPRPQTEAAAFLDIYKLVVEKKRLQAELESMDGRRQQIGDRLAVLETQITHMEASVQHLRDMPVADSTQTAQTAMPTLIHQSPSPNTFDMLFEEY